MKATELKKTLSDLLNTNNFDEPVLVLKKEIEESTNDIKLMKMLIDVYNRKIDYIDSLTFAEMPKTDQEKEKRECKKEIFSIYYQLVDLGDAESMYYVGIHLYSGIDKSKNIDGGLYFIKNAADLGEMRAMTTMASLYLYGKDIRKNTKKAIELAKKSEELGDPKAIFLLGECYYFGIGVEKNIEEAIKYFLRVKNDECEGLALNYLGDIYASNLLGEANPKEAFNYYKKSSDKENGTGTFNLAFCYFDGFGVNKSYAKAVTLFNDMLSHRSKYSSDQIEAVEVTLAYCYTYGYGLEKDLKQANKLYKIASKNGDVRGTFSLGVNYEKGIGFKVDFDKALIFYDKAALMGLKIAANAARRLRRKIEKIKQQKEIEENKEKDKTGGDN